MSKNAEQKLSVAVMSKRDVSFLSPFHLNYSREKQLH